MIRCCCECLACEIRFGGQMCVCRSFCCASLMNCPPRAWFWWSPSCMAMCQGISGRRGRKTDILMHGHATWDHSRTRSACKYFYFPGLNYPAYFLSVCLVIFAYFLQTFLAYFLRTCQCMWRRFSSSCTRATPTISEVSFWSCDTAADHVTLQLIMWHCSWSWSL